MKIVDDNRLRIIENIKKAVSENDLNRKVEEGDPIVTEEQRKEVILDFDILRKKVKNLSKAEIARSIADKVTKQMYAETEIIGLENIEGIDSAIITANHFSKVDSTVTRHCMQKLGKSKNLYIIVQESNMFMPGEVGFLLKNCYTVPISSNYEYTINNMMPALEEIFKNKNYLLIYPEKEMWYNYKKPRPNKIGAYHYACKFNVPVIPFFIEIIDSDTINEEGFYASKYKLHILKPIYPDESMPFKLRKEKMRKQDFDMRVKKYEEVYGVKYDNTFDVKRDIAGWVE